MKVIVLVGKSNTGKTTTLNRVAVELINRGYTQELYEKIGHLDEDFRAILVKEGIKVGIATVGDFHVNESVDEEVHGNGAKSFNSYLKGFEDENCHKVIVPISLGVNSEKVIKSVLPPFSYVVRKQPPTPNKNLQIIINTQDAQTILSLLDS